MKILKNKNTIICKNNFGEEVAVAKEKFQFRPSVYGIIKNNGKICICKNRSNNKIWFPGGGIEKGEKITDALLREIQEETGLNKIKIIKSLGSFESFFYYQPKDCAMHAFLFFYECSTNESDLLSDEKINDEEAYKLQWVEIHQIKKEDLSDLNEELFNILQLLK